MTTSQIAPSSLASGPNPGAAVVVGGLVMLALLGLDVVGWVPELNQAVAVYFSERFGESFPQHLPLSARWGGAALMAFGLPLCVFACAGAWRRLLLWWVAVGVMVAWAPVLCLAAHQPEVALPGLAALGSGLIAILYAGWSERRCGEVMSDPDETS